MRGTMRVVSFLGLALVLAPAAAYLAGAVGKGTMTTIMLVGTLVWFGSAPFWMDGKASG